jgi:hypothetical protein
MNDVICWKGTHTEDWPSWARFHRELAAHEAKRGNAPVAKKHEEIACKYDRRADRAAKKARKAAAS